MMDKSVGGIHCFREFSIIRGNGFHSLENKNGLILKY